MGNVIFSSSRTNRLHTLIIKTDPEYQLPSASVLRYLLETFEAETAQEVFQAIHQMSLDLDKVRGIFHELDEVQSAINKISKLIPEEAKS